VIYDGGSFETSKELDIKMIDFANCVTNAHSLFDYSKSAVDPSSTTATPSTVEEIHPLQVNFPPTTKGPDKGYLLGIQTLIKSFEELYQELGGPVYDGHVLKEKISKSARANAELGSVNPLGTPSSASGLGVGDLGDPASPVVTGVDPDLSSLPPTSGI
jgi:hypothetical protein